MIAASDDGVFVGTEKQILWLPGESPQAWDFKEVANYGAIPGALDFCDGELIGDSASKGTTVAVFASTQGLCAGFPGGAIVNFLNGHFAYPVQERGACVVRKHRGIAQCVATLQGTPVAGNVYS